MKNVQISEELFVAIMRYFMLEQEELLPQIKQGLEKKLAVECRFRIFGYDQSKWASELVSE